ncbi:LysE family translocator [Halosquirtibacter xylanolyticus]|uniref:LysE family translocator n=1 Tax=Halosquirtibacter xylanolyticus TaxID=3374599 RepID=UPI0037487B76|nr:LysE family translocator [Prolixibacteraceae bacterium]
MFISQILAFLSAAFLLAIMPGPDNIFVLTESITKGAKNGIQISLGLSLGVLVHTTAVATGLSLILTESEVAFRLVKYAGAGYLLYLAYHASKEQPISVDLENPVSNNTGVKRVSKGFLMNILNPKVSLFFIGFLPQFVRQGSFSPMVQMMILGAIFMGISFITFSGFAILSGKLTEIFERPSFWKITKWTKCIVFIILASALILG